MTNFRMSATMSTATQSMPNNEFAAAFRDMMAPTLIEEMETTKKVILAIPEDRKAWKPDPKAKSAWELALHIVQTGIWILEGVAERTFNAPDEKAAHPELLPELVSFYDAKYRECLQRVEKLTPEQLANPVSFFGMINPNYTYLRLEFQHQVHHRGQLSTYLRPMGSKIPSIYFGSADEPYQPSA